MGAPSRPTPHTVSFSRVFHAFVCALVVASSQALRSHGFVSSSAVRFNYRYGGHCANAALQGNCVSSSAVQTAAAAARSSSPAAATAAAPGSPPRAFIRGAAAAAGGGKVLSSALFSEPPAAGTAADPELLEKIKDVVAEQLKVDRGKIQLESNFIKDLNADSLDSVELVMAFEEKFGVTIPDEAATKIATVSDALSYIQKAK